MGAAFTIPDAILADIVDYDELHTGLRNEGLYSVVENNLQQYVEIIGGVVPGIVAGLSGFVSNGGCSCGCGTACPQPYLRWSCEAPVSGLPDIGYACSSDFTAEVLNGDVDPYLLCLPTYLLCLPPTYYVGRTLLTMYLLCPRYSTATSTAPRHARCRRTGCSGLSASSSRSCRACATCSRPSRRRS